MTERYELLWDPDGETVSVQQSAPVDIWLYEEGPDPLSYSQPVSVAQDIEREKEKYRALVSLPGDRMEGTYELSLEEFETMFKEPFPLRDTRPRFQYRIELCDSRDDLLQVRRHAIQERNDQRYIH